jgi:hypothetical protein
MALALVGNHFVRKRLPPDQPWEHNDVAGAILAVVTGLYGLVLAFVIVAVWEDFRATQDSVSSEATALAEVVRDAQAFPEPARTEITQRVGDYVQEVIDHEWHLIASGKESVKAASDITAIFGAVERFQPETPSQTTFHQEAASALNTAVFSRRSRIFASTNSIPQPLTILIVGGAIVCVGFLFFLRVPNPRAQQVMILSVTALLTFELLLALLLSNPFAGDVTVSNLPLRSGALAPLYHKR